MRASDAGTRLRAAVVAAIAALGLAAAPATGRAQGLQLGEYCNAEAVQEADTAQIPEAVRRQHPLVVVASFRARIEQRDWSGIVSQLLADFDATGQPELPTDVAQRFRRQLAAADSEFRAIAASSDFARLLATSSGADLQRFRIERRTRQGGGAAFVVFSRFADSIVVTAAESDSVKRNVCWRALAAHWILDEYRQPGIDVVINALDRRLEAWDAYLRSGPTQYPWELYINGLPKRRWNDLTPPRQQLIFLHPSAALQVRGTMNDLKREEVLAVEWLGYVRFIRDHRASLGISALSSFPREAPANLGAMLHWGRVFNLAYLHTFNGGRDRHGILMSADLYRLFVGVPRELEGTRNSISSCRDEARSSVVNAIAPGSRCRELFGR